VRISERCKGDTLIEPALPREQGQAMKKLVLFSDSCIYIQTVDEKPAEKIEQ
jgi:hypothetical protein